MKLTMGLLLVAMMILLTACGGSAVQVDDGPTATAGEAGGRTAGEGSALGQDYPDALAVRNQLTLGTLRLEDTPSLAMTSEQATALLPLWQGLRSITQSGTGATEEIDALLAQVEAELTTMQLEAISAMHLTRADTQSVAQEWGLSTGTGPGTGQPGSGRNLSDAQRAEREAARTAAGGSVGMGSGGGSSSALLDRLIQLLQERAG